ncbi:hypothetical protein ABZV14_05720 [Streptosporangium canum]|uniref:phage terminase small subunit n=1 Tax=Streptosporangium canum TaxID=324952 RepID=UPI0033A12C6C
MLAPLVEQYWQDPKASVLAEIRLNEERLGATIRDRQSLRMSFEDKQPKTPNELPPEVADIERFRQAYGG